MTESGIFLPVESGIQKNLLMESGILYFGNTAQEIRKSTNDWNSEFEFY